MKNKPSEETVKEFKKELKELLKKYNSEIWVELDGDTHGVSAAVVIDIGDQTVIRNEFGCLGYKEIKD